MDGPMGGNLRLSRESEDIMDMVGIVCHCLYLTKGHQRSLQRAGHQPPLHFLLQRDTKDHLIVHCYRPSRTNPFSGAKDHQLPLYFPLQLAINYRFIFWCNGPLHFPLQQIINDHSIFTYNGPPKTSTFSLATGHQGHCMFHYNRPPTTLHNKP